MKGAKQIYRLRKGAIFRLMNNSMVTVEGLSAMLGVSGSAVYGWLNDKHTPRKEHIRMMCELFSCDIGDLVCKASMSVRKYKPKSVRVTCPHCGATFRVTGRELIKMQVEQPS